MRRITMLIVMIIVAAVFVLQNENKINVSVKGEVEQVNEDLDNDISVVPAKTLKTDRGVAKGIINGKVEESLNEVLQEFDKKMSRLEEIVGLINDNRAGDLPESLVKEFFEVKKELMREQKRIIAKANIEIRVIQDDVRVL